MASSIHILDSRGGPIISRTYRGDVDQNVPQVFMQRVLDDEEGVGPVFQHRGYVYVHTRHNDVFFVAVSKINCVPLMLLSFIKSAIDVFKGYFTRVTEESLRDNFVVVYELLDEMADFGLPQFTEEKILKDFIAQSEIYKLPFLQDPDKLDVKPLPASVTGVNGANIYRQPGISHRKNEVFVDVCETINLLADKNGEPLHTEICGCIRMSVKLSGEPEVTMGLNDRMHFEATGKSSTGKLVDMDDVKFHGCVRLNRFALNREICFIPPEGDFDLMTYRIQAPVRPLIHITTNVVRHGTSRVEIQLQLKSTYKKNAISPLVEVFIPIPVDADTPSARPTQGTIKYKPDEEALVWQLTELPGGREARCSAQYTLPSVRASDPSALVKKPIRAKWTVNFHTISGMQVRFLKVTEPKLKYETVPWVRYSSKAGEYQIRTA